MSVILPIIVVVLAGGVVGGMVCACVKLREALHAPRRTAADTRRYRAFMRGSAPPRTWLPRNARPKTAEEGAHLRAAHGVAVDVATLDDSRVT